jgi:hypothetical protein
MDTIFYCDISETFQSPDEEPREVFRQRLTDVCNTEENGNFGDENNSWVNALHRVSVHFEGDNPLEFVNYTITIPSGCFNLSLTMPLVKGLKDKDVIHYARGAAIFENITFEVPSHEERVSYFVNSLSTNREETVVGSGQELVDPSEIF